MSDLRAWFGAVLKHWFSALSGALIAVLGLINTLIGGHDLENPRTHVVSHHPFVAVWVVWLASLLLLGFAMFRTWRDMRLERDSEHALRVSAEQQHQELTARVTTLQTREQELERQLALHRNPFGNSAHLDLHATLVDLVSEADALIQATREAPKPVPIAHRVSLGGRVDQWYSRAREVLEPAGLANQAEIGADMVRSGGPDGGPCVTAEDFEHYLTKRADGIRRLLQ